MKGKECIHVTMYLCYNVPMLQYTYVTMYQCTYVTMYLCYKTNVQVKRLNNLTLRMMKIIPEIRRVH
jgi:hypothetical protein